MANNTEAIEALAAEIGEEIYIDVAKWHLFLSDAHLHMVLAERLYSLMANNSLNEDKVLKILREITVELGGGKTKLPLIDLLPMQCQVNLLDLLEDYQQKL